MRLPRRLLLAGALLTLLPGCFEARYAPCTLQCDQDVDDCPDAAQA